MTKNSHAFPYHPELMPEPVNLGDRIRNRRDARGMTLRDYFAAQALTGWISRYGPVDLKDGARRCYQIADAMLETRGDGRS